MRTIRAIALFVPLLLAGCSINKPAKLPTGAINSFDADTYATLSTAQAVILSLMSTIVETPALKPALNQAIADYNVAERAYLAYHSGATANTTGLTGEIAVLLKDISALQSSVSTGGK